MLRFVPLLMVAYLFIGLVLARLITPLSFPFRRNALLVTIAWPWPLAAQLCKELTGRYPRWSPPL